MAEISECPPGNANRAVLKRDQSLLHLFRLLLGDLFSGALSPLSFFVFIASSLLLFQFIFSLRRSRVWGARGLFVLIGAAPITKTTLLLRIIPDLHFLFSDVSTSALPHSFVVAAAVLS